MLGGGYVQVYVDGQVFYADDRSFICRRDLETGQKYKLIERRDEDTYPLFCCVDNWLFVEIGTINGRKRTYAVNLTNNHVQHLMDDCAVLVTDSLTEWQSVPIRWKDAGVEAGVRVALNKPEGDILPSDTVNITRLYLYAGAVGSLSEITDITPSVGRGYTMYQGVAYSDRAYRTLEDLALFPRLEKLDISGRIACSLKPLSHLRNLHTLCLQATVNPNWNDGSLGTLSQVQSLSLADMNVIDLSILHGMTALKQLEIATSAVDFTPLADLPNLESVYIRGDVTRPTFDALAALCPGVSFQADSVPPA